jgi:hypothetical protein
VTALASAYNCSASWPSNLQSLERCCRYPSSLALGSSGSCAEICQNSTNPLCVGECYAAGTSYIANGKFDKTKITFNLLQLVDKDRYFEVTTKAIDKCAKVGESQPNVNLQLAAFESCLRSELTQNCVEFLDNALCDRAAKYFEECVRPKADCSTWPKRFKAKTLQNCCVTPFFLDNEGISKCDKKCWFESDAQCFMNCLFEHSGFVQENRFNLTVVKAGLKARKSTGAR